MAIHSSINQSSYQSVLASNKRATVKLYAITVRKKK